MRTIIGTSGWLYKDWDGRFYPADVKPKDRFAYFTTQFDSVEINSTFYHVPRESTLKSWYDTAPSGFCFAIKLNRYLTHSKRLHGDQEFDEALGDFFKRLRLLKDKLAVVLVQLPPGLRADNERLEHLAKAVERSEKQLKMRFRLAIEFRHASWFNEGTFALMRRYGLINVINDSPDRWPASKEITTDAAYIRFHGNRRLYRSSYTDSEMNEWADFITGTGCDTVFAYFNNDYNAVAVDNARTLIKQLKSL